MLVVLNACVCVCARAYSTPSFTDVSHIVAAVAFPHGTGVFHNNTHTQYIYIYTCVVFPCVAVLVDGCRGIQCHDASGERVSLSEEVSSESLGGGARGVQRAGRGQGRPVCSFCGGFIPASPKHFAEGGRGRGV